MAESLFSVGMGPNQIDPSKLAQVSNQLAIVKGTVAGLQQAAQGQAARAMEAATVPLDQIAGPIHEGVGNALGGVQMAQAGLGAIGNQAARTLLEPAIRQVIPLGYTPTDLSILTPPKRSNGRRRKNGPSLGPQMAVAQPRIATSSPSIGSSSGTVSQSISNLTPGTPGQFVPGGQTCQTPGGTVVPCAFPQPGGPAPSPPALPVPPLPLPGGGTAPTVFNPMPPIGGATGCTAQGVPVACAPAGAPGTPPPSPPPTVTVPGGQTLPTCGYVVVQDMTPQGTPTGNAPWLFGVREWMSQYAAGGYNYSLVGPILAYYPTSDAAFGSWPNLRGGLWSPSDACALPPAAPPPGQLQPSPPATCPPPQFACPPSQVTVNVPPCPTGQERPAPPEGECSIAWLNLYYPDFVLASRSTGKSDYDILVDAVSLELCQGKPEQPGCSMPYLQRLFPDFVRAAKEQGLTDDEVLQQAVNIGLCADQPVSSGLGEQNVGDIAPGSAEALTTEFDPSKRGEIPPSSRAQVGGPLSRGKPKSPGFGAPGGSCALDVPQLPDLTAEIDNAKKLLGECTSAVDAPIAALIDALVKFISDNTECKDDSLVRTLNDFSKSIRETRHDFLGNAIHDSSQFLIWAIRVSLGAFQSIAHYFSAGEGCDGERLGSVLLAKSVVGLWEKWISVLPDELHAILDRQSRYVCPTGLPNVAEANDLYASNFISFEQWRCIQKTNGVQTQWQEPLAAARQARPNDQELLNRQRYINARIEQLTPARGPLDLAETQALSKELLLIESLYKHNGWTNSDNFGEWQNCQLWVPNTSDAIEWMIKDVNDPQITETFLLGAEFQQKYGGDVKRAFRQNGVTDTDALNIWKAHWRNIAPHQVYEMHKRLRPGWTLLMTDAEVTLYFESICPRKGPNVTPAVLAARPVSNGFPVPTYCDEAPTPAQQRAYLESLVVTGYHASEALGQDDYPAFWRPRLLALSYNVMTRVDARRAYEIGIFSEEKLTAVLMDRGYSLGDAQALTAFYRANNIKRFANSPTAKEWIQYPYQTLILQQNLRLDGMRDDLWPDVYEILLLKRDTYKRVQQLKTLKAEVKKGRIGKAQAVKQAQGILQG